MFEIRIVADCYCICF